MSIGSEVFSLFICFDANKFVLLSFFTMTEATCAKFGQKKKPNNAKSPLPVDVRCSKTVLLKLRHSNTRFSENVAVAETSLRYH